MRQSRVVVKDQWASHPSTEERNIFIKTLNIESTDSISEKPWLLFDNPEILQKKLTEILFINVKYKGPVNTLDFTTFKEKYYNEFISRTFQKEYNGFYDNRKISMFNLKEIFVEDHPKFKSFNELFTSENCSLANDLEMLNSDIDLLNEISANLKIIKTFDYEGRKYISIEAPTLVKKLEDERASLKGRILEIDKEVFKFFKARTSDNRSSILESKYEKYFMVLSDLEKFFKNYNELNSNLGSIYHRQIPMVEARQIIDQVKIYEQIIINQLRGVLHESKEQRYLERDQFLKIDLYLSKDLKYINDGGFIDSELEFLNEVLGLFIRLMIEREFQTKKDLLHLQLDSISNN